MREQTLDNIYQTVNLLKDEPEFDANLFADLSGRCKSSTLQVLELLCKKEFVTKKKMPVLGMPDGCWRYLYKIDPTKLSYLKSSLANVHNYQKELGYKRPKDRRGLGKLGRKMDANVETELRNTVKNLNNRFTKKEFLNRIRLSDTTAYAMFNFMVESDFFIPLDNRARGGKFKQIDYDFDQVVEAYNNKKREFKRKTMKKMMEKQVIKPREQMDKDGKVDELADRLLEKCCLALEEAKGVQQLKEDNRQLMEDNKKLREEIEEQRTTANQIMAKIQEERVCNRQKYYTLEDIEKKLGI